MSSSFPVSLQRAYPYLAPATSLGLAVVLGVLSAQLLWQVVPESTTWPEAVTPVTAEATATAEKRDIETILRGNLFGVATSTPAPAPEPVEAPVTSLNLTLTGIISATVPENSRALISQQNGTHKAYAVGDTVVSGVKLHSVLSDHVILERRGRFETLRLDKNKPSSSADGRGGVPQSSARVTSARVASPEVSASLSRIREELIADPGQASQYLRVQPSRAASGSGLKGYRIYPGRNRALFQQAGLRPGDLVTSVNGVPLDDPAKGLQLLGDLSQASQVTVTIERAGRSQTLSVDLR